MHCVAAAALYCVLRVHLQVVARRAAEAVADGMRRDLDAARRDLDAARDALSLERSRATAAVSELTALRAGLSAAAAAVRGVLTAAVTDAEEQLRAVLKK